MSINARILRLDLQHRAKHKLSCNWPITEIEHVLALIQYLTQLRAMAYIDYPIMQCVNKGSCHFHYRYKDGGIVCTGMSATTRNTGVEGMCV